MISEAALLPQAMPLPDWKKVAKQIHALAYNFQEALARHGSGTKNNRRAMLAEHYFLCPGAVVATYT